MLDVDTEAREGIKKLVKEAQPVGFEEVKVVVVVWGSECR
jgi:hypothetical protein